MAMAQAVSQLISQNLRHSNGLPVECVIADTTIGGVTEAAKCADKFAKEGVGVSLSVTPCWCYGMETIDMDSLIPKAGLAVATMKGKSYLSVGSVSMGIAGSQVSPDFFQDYLGMRVEYVDMSEMIRRIEEEIYDQEEYPKALRWVKENCPEGEDRNKKEIRHSRQQKDAEWEMVVKMTLIARDLMIGNERLTEIGLVEEAEGHNAIVAGFQGQRQWTDHFPNGDFMETILNTSFDWNGIREAFIFATENDSLNGVAMLFNHLLTDRAQIFSDIRTYWSPEAVKRVTGKELTGLAKDGILHLINSGATTLDATGQQKEDGKDQPH
jgi:L-fucose isomerase